ncbi:MAG: hypothetical protein JWP25_7250 [Bradyrhizobium sp.]|nr:hypothetical protein [Bradyrhizobium sp.]
MIANEPERASILALREEWLIGASLAWLIVSVAA